MNKLFQSFANIQYVDKNHTYYDNETGQELVSVTKLIKKLKSDFNSDYWSVFTSLKRQGYAIKPIYPDFIKYEKINLTVSEAKEIANRGVPSVSDILYEWKISALVGQTLGTYLHNNIEHRFLRKAIDQPIPEFVMSLKTLDAIKYIKSRELLDKMADDFYNEFTKTYSPVVTEFVVGDAELGIAGTFDLLAYNNITEQYELWDYKTDKEIKFKSDYNNKINYFNIDDCEFNKYSLQLSIYKYLIEKNTDITIDSCSIAHFSTRTNNIEIIQIQDFTKEVAEFFEQNENKSIYF